MLAPQIEDSHAPGITILVTYSAAEMLRLSCLLTHALMLLETIANLNDAIVI